MLQLTSRRFLRELDKAFRGNNLQYILKCPCILFFGNQGLHNEIMLGDNGGCSGVMCEGSLYNNLCLYCRSKDHKVDGCPRKQLVRAQLTTLEEQETLLSENLSEN